MAHTLDRPPLIARGRELDMSPSTFGELQVSTDILNDPEALRERMDSDGYLFLPGYLDREEVLDARGVITDRLADAGWLEPGHPPIEAVAKKDRHSYFNPGLADGNAPLMKLLYAGRMMEFYERLLGGPVRHFDFTWMRAVTPGAGTSPHCDIVYMGRGTKKLYTAWTPLGDIPIDMGGLIVLENSHKHERLKANYGSKDADEWCTNRRDAATEGPGGDGNIGAGGALTHNPVKLRERLGGRWLTSDFRAGDLLTFSVYLVHASLDNGSDRVRLSSDTRYQLASEPADERWIGENPPAHSLGIKRGLIC